MGDSKFESRISGMTTAGPRSSETHFQQTVIAYVHAYMYSIPAFRRMYMYVYQHGTCIG